MGFKLICKDCGKATYRSYQGKNFTCRFCKVRQEITEELETGLQNQQEEIVQEQENEMSGILDNISPEEDSQDIKFRVEPVTAEIKENSGMDSPTSPLLTRTSKATGSTKLLPTKKEPLPWAPDTFRKAFEMVDATMKAKSNSEIWDVSKEEERKLAEMWADVANEYAPKASSKEVKLIMATVGTGAVYVPRIITLVQAHKLKKKRDLPTEVKIEETKEEEIKQQEEIVVNPSPDADFGDKWKNAKPGDSQ